MLTGRRKTIELSLQAYCLYCYREWSKPLPDRDNSHSPAKIGLYWFWDWYESEWKYVLFLQQLKSVTVFLKVRKPDGLRNIKCKCVCASFGIRVCVFSIFKCPKYDKILTREREAPTRSGHWPRKPGLEAWFPLMWLAASDKYWAVIGYWQQWYTGPSGLA